MIFNSLIYCNKLSHDFLNQISRRKIFRKYDNEIVLVYVSVDAARALLYS